MLHPLDQLVLQYAYANWTTYALLNDSSAAGSPPLGNLSARAFQAHLGALTKARRLSGTFSGAANPQTFLLCGRNCCARRLDLAKQRLRHCFSVVGTLEDPAATANALKASIPDAFGTLDADAAEANWQRESPSSVRAAVRALREAMSQETTQKAELLAALDLELYAWARGLLLAEHGQPDRRALSSLR